MRDCHTLLAVVLAFVGPACVSGNDVSSCCTRVQIDSAGDATDHQGNRMGTYFIHGILAGKPIYKHEDRSEYLYYLTSRRKGLWMVGPKPSQYNGGLAHRDDNLCVEDVTPGEWKYTDGTAWHVDSQLSVTCLDEPVSPECTYNDGIEFVGGDLPEPFGGGGIVTSMNSSAECIDECERRSGCKYWTWIQKDGPNCFLKKDKMDSIRKPKHVSGSIPSACISNSVTGTRNELKGSVLTEQEPAERDGTADNQVYNENEIIAKFKIMMKFTEQLRDPESEEYQDLANTIEKDLLDMLNSEKALQEQADFSVAVTKFEPGSVVCNFKVNYVIKEAYIGIPFVIQPANISDTLHNNFRFKKGILFQRFLIASGSFNSTNPVDHCAHKGCSHKCDYNYDIEDYVCTCPRTLVLGEDKLTCLTPEEAEEEKIKATTVSEIEASTVTVEDVDATTVSVEAVDATEPTDDGQPKDCEWGEWSEWGECSCQLATQERIRSVAVPAVNGGNCDGKFKEVTSCEPTSCDEATTQLNEVPAEAEEDSQDFGRKLDETTTDAAVPVDTTTISVEVFTEISEEEQDEANQEPELTTTASFGNEVTTVEATLDDDADSDITTQSDAEIEEEEVTTAEAVQDDDVPELTTESGIKQVDEESTEAEGGEATTDAGGEATTQVVGEGATEAAGEATTEAASTEEDNLTTDLAEDDMTEAPADETVTQLPEVAPAEESTDAPTEAPEDLAVPAVGQEEATTEQEELGTTAEPDTEDVEATTTGQERSLLEDEEAASTDIPIVLPITEEAVADEETTTTQPQEDKEETTAEDVIEEETTDASVDEELPATTTAEDLPVDEEEKPLEEQVDAEETTFAPAEEEDSSIEARTEALEVIATTEVAVDEAAEDETTTGDDMEENAVTTEAALQADDDIESATADEAAEELTTPASSVGTEVEDELTTAAMLDADETDGQTTTEGSFGARIDAEQLTTIEPSVEEETVSEEEEMEGDATTTEAVLDEADNEIETATPEVDKAETSAPMDTPRSFPDESQTVPVVETTTQLNIEEVDATTVPATAAEAVAKEAEKEAAEEEASTEAITESVEVAVGAEETTTSKAMDDDIEEKSIMTETEEVPTDDLTTQESVDGSDVPADVEFTTEALTIEGRINEDGIDVTEAADVEDSAAAETTTAGETLMFDAEPATAESAAGQTTGQPSLTEEEDQTEAATDGPEDTTGAFRTDLEGVDDAAATTTMISGDGEETTASSVKETTLYQLPEEAGAEDGTDAEESTTVRDQDEATEAEVPASEPSDVEATTAQAAAENQETDDEDIAVEPRTESVEVVTSEDEQDEDAIELTTVSVIAMEVSQDGGDVMLTTTVSPVADDAETATESGRSDVSAAAETTTSPIDGGIHEFSCVEMDGQQLGTADDQIPMDCTLENEEEQKRIYIVIRKDQVDPERFFGKNVKIVIRDFTIMDISPK